jgi:hypothetical protein
MCLPSRSGSSEHADRASIDGRSPPVLPSRSTARRKDQDFSRAPWRAHAIIRCASSRTTAAKAVFDLGPKSRLSREFGNSDVLAALRLCYSTGGLPNCKSLVSSVHLRWIESVAGLSHRHSKPAWRFLRPLAGKLEATMRERGKWRVTVVETAVTKSSPSARLAASRVVESTCRALRQ